MRPATLETAVTVILQCTREVHIEVHVYKICDVSSAEIDECEVRPCSNGASCADGFNSFTCSCLAGFEGDTCDGELMIT